MYIRIVYITSHQANGPYEAEEKNCMSYILASLPEIRDIDCRVFVDNCQ